MSSQFKFKPDRVKYTTKVDTLTGSHKKMTEEFSKKEKKLSTMKKKVEKFKEKITFLNKNVATVENYSGQKSELLDKISKMESEIQRIESNTDELDYISRVHDVVFIYYKEYDDQDDIKNYSKQAIKHYSLNNTSNKDLNKENCCDNISNVSNIVEDSIVSDKKSTKNNKRKSSKITSSDSSKNSSANIETDNNSLTHDNNNDNNNDNNDNNNNINDNNNDINDNNEDNRSNNNNDNNSNDNKTQENNSDEDVNDMNVSNKTISRLERLNNLSKKKLKEKKETKKRVKNGKKANTLTKKDIFSYIDPDNDMDKEEGNNKATLFAKYNTLLYGLDNEKIISKICKNCKVDKQMIYNEGLYVCPKCHKAENSIIESEVTNYKDPMVEKTTFPYERKNHFREWISQLQAKESKEIPHEVIDLIKSELKKYRETRLSYAKIDKVKKILKKLNLSDYYDHVVYIISVINKESPPSIDRDTEEILNKMFDMTQKPFEDHCPKDRINFLSYGFILHKFFQLIGKKDYCKYFPLLKSRSKRRIQDAIWKKICADLNWKYYPSG